MEQDEFCKLLDRYMREMNAVLLGVDFAAVTSTISVEDTPSSPGSPLLLPNLNPALRGS